MGYLSLYKTLADYNKDASNRQNPHVSLITDDKKLILINSSNVSKEISNVKIIESLTPAPENDTTTTSSEVPTTTTSDTTPTPGGTYFTEMPISVKLVDNDGNEVKDIVPVTFSIDCNGYSKSITLTSSGTLSGYHPLDNNGIESFFIDCDAEMHYKDGNEYYVMPEITSYGQFSNYYHKGGAIYIFVYSLVTPAPTTT